LAKRPGDRYDTAGALAADARAALAPPPFAPPSAPVTRRRWTVVAAGAAMIAILALVLALTLGRSHGRIGATPTTQPSVEPTTASPGPAIPVNSVLQVDPKTEQVERTVSGALRGDSGTNGGNPVLAVGEGAVWVAWGSWVTPVEPQTGQHPEPIVYTCQCAGPGQTIALGLRTVWLPGVQADNRAGLVQRVDPATDKPLKAIHLAAGLGGPQGLGTGSGTLWAVFGNGTVLGFDATGRITHQLEVHKSLDRVVVGFDSVWILDKLDGLVIRVDPTKDAVIDTIHVTGSLSAIALGAGGLWVVDGIGGTVVPIDPSADRAGTPIRVGDAPTGIAAGLGGVWVTDKDGSIYRIDPVTHDKSTIDIGTPLTAIAVDQASRTLWVTATVPD